MCPGQLVSGGLSGMGPGGDVVEDPCSRHLGVPPWGEINVHCIHLNVNRGFLMMPALYP